MLESRITDLIHCMMNSNLDKYPQIKDNSVKSMSDYYLMYSIILESRITHPERSMIHTNLDSYPQFKDNTMKPLFVYLL
jgi:hypothetical protein